LNDKNLRDQLNDFRQKQTEKVLKDVL